jgi:PhzF family phenazine biosynthesis protein
MRVYQVDAFTTRRFAGNPAAVMPLKSFLDDVTLQSIAAENNLSETAFLVPRDGDYQLRWFTPATEVPLCGHATLASSAVVMEKLEPGRTGVTFQTASGPLIVTKAATGYVMDFPARLAQPIAPPLALEKALGIKPVEVLADAFNYTALLQSADAVRTLAPDFAAIAQLDRAGVIVTAAGEGTYDCVSRYFAPAKGIAEDPVTGGAHCMLTPYWCGKLNKNELRCYQASPRGGEMICRLRGQRVELEGSCVFYMEGEVELG